MGSNEEQIKSEEMLETKNPIMETIEVLNNIKDNTIPCIQMTRNLLLRIKDKQLSTESGISFLELKNRIFANYLIDLTFLVSNKLNGKQLEGNECINRLVEWRTVLEKMRPIEYRLKYQIDKLIKTSITGTIDTSDPLRLKPKFDNIIDDNNEMSIDSDIELNSEDNDNHIDKNDDKKKPKSGVYVPPKVAQMRFDEEEDRKVKAFERAKKRAMSSSIINELKREFDDRPEEVIDSLHSNKNKKINKFLKEKTAYEEEYLTRMNLTKKQRNESKQMSSMTGLSSGVTRFEDISALDIDSPQQFSFPNKKKRSSKQKSSKKFKKFSKSKK